MDEVNRTTGGVSRWAGIVVFLLTSWRFVGAAVAAQTEPPGIPVVPATSATGNYMVTWAPSSTGGATYTLQEATDSGFTAGLRTAYGLTSPSALITGRATATTYYYRAQATATGHSPSVIVSGANGCAVTLPAAAPGSPVVPATSTTGSYTVTWGPSSTSGATYTLVEATNPAFTEGLRLAYSGAVPSASITGRATAITYYYAVLATASEHSASSWVKGANGCAVTLAAEAPGTPVLPATSTTGSYAVTWTASPTSGASYTLQEATNSSFTEALRTVYTGLELSASITGRPSGATYYYRVQAVAVGYAASNWVPGANGCAVTPSQPRVQPQLAVGGAHVVALRSDGTLWAWGYNGAGELGDGTDDDRSTPTPIGVAEDWRAIAAGGRHTVAIKADGSLWAWGDNSYGQLGNGSAQSANAPIPIGAEADWHSVSAGSYHTVAIKADGSLWAWGVNWQGQIGDGSTEDRNVPVHIGTDSDWKALAAGADHTVAVKNDGTLWAWGGNGAGQLGDGTYLNRLTPSPVGADRDWVAVAAGGGFTFGIKTDGSLWAWGANSAGQLGDGTTESRSQPVQIVSESSWRAVSAGTDHVVAIQEDGSLWSWGGNSYGQLGDDTTTSRSLPRQVGSETSWVAGGAGGSFTVALRNDGSLWACGEGSSGQLGNGYSWYVVSPAAAGGGQWRAVAAGDAYTLGIRPDGSLWEWGSNWAGQLGDGTNTSRSAPVQVGLQTDWATVAAGEAHTVAIRNGGTLWSWGSNDDGQLGDGSNESSSVPTQVGVDSDWRVVVAGSYHTLSIKTDGSLWAWGYNADGQLGDGTNINRDAPTRIGTDNDWSAIAAGDTHSLALKSDGTLWAWGYNEDGELGDGTTENKNLPTQIGTENNWSRIDAGYYHTVALKADGTLWAWGYNANGQLGDGTTDNRTSPTGIGLNNDWASFAAGGYHTIAIKTEGGLWAWGRNRLGQIGDGTTEDKLAPTRIGAGSDWTGVAAGAMHSVALKADGSIWAWGWNSEGQVGGAPSSSATLGPVPEFRMLQGSPVPLVPTDLVGRRGATASTVSLAWTASIDDTGGLSYNVYRDGQKIATSATPTFTETVPDAGASYQYRVSASDVDGNESGQSIPWTRYPRTVLPPTNLTGWMGNDPQEAVLAWTAPEGGADPTWYKIYRNGNRIGSATALTFTDALPDPAETYQYEVTACDATGDESDRSTPWTKPDWIPPSTPSGLTCRRGETPGTITLGWEAATDNVGVVAYGVYRDSLQVGESAETGFVDVRELGSAPHSYQVDARDAAGNRSPLSQQCTIAGMLDSDGDGLDDNWELDNFGTLLLGPNDDPDHDGITNLQEFLLGTETRDLLPPAVPTNLSVRPGGASNPGVVYLAWDASTDNVLTSGYNVYIDGQRVGSTPATSTSVGGAWGTCNGFHVTAVDASGNESAPSASIWGRGSLPQPSIWIVSPQPGQTVSSQWITVWGGGVSTAGFVVVNGQKAVVRDGVFSADMVELEPGENTISVVASNTAGDATEYAVTVIRTGADEPIRLTPSRTSGLGPLAVEFVTSTGLSGTIVKYEWDLDGDGLFELESTTPAVQSYTFMNPRLYRVRARITDSAGTAYTAVAPVRVYLPPALLEQYPAQGPAGIHVDSNGLLYVAEQNAGRVAVYGPDGSLLRRVGTLGTGAGQLSGPAGVAVDEAGNLFVTDAAYPRVSKFDSNGNFLLEFGQDALASPSGISVRGSEVLVADTLLNEVVRFSTDGRLAGTIGDTQGPGVLNSPMGLTNGPGGEIVVADSSNHRIVRFDSWGSYLGSFGSFGSGDGQFNTPTAVSWNASQELLTVADTGNSRVVVFTPDGLVKTVAQGSQLGFSSPAAATTDEEEFRQLLYVGAAADGVLKFELPVPSPAEVWDSMRASVALGHSEEALAFFQDATRERQREFFCYAGSHLSSIVAGFPPITPEYIRSTVAKYKMEGEEEIDGVTTLVRHYVYFDKDENDEWRIRDF